MLKTPRWSPSRAHIFFIVLAAVVFYGRVVDNYWFKDDLNLHLLAKPGTAALDWSKLPSFLWPSHMTSEQYWRPIPIILGFIDYALWGTAPAGYHIVNILFHALNGVLFYFVLNRLTNFARPTAGFFGALAFTLNPVNAEAVVWILQRMVLMCATFSLAGILAWLKAAESGKMRWRVFGLICVACAALSKEIAATLPATYFMIDFFWAPEGSAFRERLRRAIRGAIPCAILVGLYTLLRFLIFKRLTIKYAGLEPAEYARHNKVFERLGSSLYSGFVPVNHAVAEGLLRTVLEKAILVAFALAVLRGLTLLLTNPDFRRVLWTAAVFGLTSFVPVLYIFWIDDELFNARFFYQPGLATMLVAFSALALPLRRDGPASGADRWIERAGAALMIGAFAVALSLGIGAFEGGSHEVRGIQQAISKYAASETAALGKDVAIVALGVPSRWKGVPTLEWNLDLALAPPLHFPRVPVITLLDTDRPNWFAHLEARRAALGKSWTDLRYVRCEYEPPGATPMFGAPEPAEGPFPAELAAPEDGRAYANGGDEPVFRIRPSGGAARFRFVFVTDDAIGTVTVNAAAGRNMAAEGDDLTWRPSAKDAENPAFPDIWSAAVRKPLDRPASLFWRVESLDAAGRRIGVSGTRRMVVFNTL